MSFLDVQKLREESLVLNAWGTLLAAGVNPAETLGVVGRMSEHFKPAFAEIQRGVEANKSIDDSLKEYRDRFSPIALMFIVAGEKSGKPGQGELESFLLRVASFLRDLAWVDQIQAKMDRGDLFKVLDMEILSRCIDAGIPLLGSVNALAEVSLSSNKETWANVAEDIRGGLSLSEAMKKYPDVFGEVAVAMVEAGEMGAVLDLALAQLADYLIWNEVESPLYFDRPGKFKMNSTL